MKCRENIYKAKDFVDFALKELQKDIDVVEFIYKIQLNKEQKVNKLDLYVSIFGNMDDITNETNISINNEIKKLGYSVEIHITQDQDYRTERNIKTKDEHCISYNVKGNCDDKDPIIIKIFNNYDYSIDNDVYNMELDKELLDICSKITLGWE